MTPDPQSAGRELDKERASFRSLLLENPNYFGNLPSSPLKPVKQIVSNSQYEQLTCVGYNPKTNFLEATVAIKLPYGYGGNLCMAGTTEYVRFFLDYGSGWEDAGLAGVRVHDIPTSKDCAGLQDKPLIYVVSLRPKPHTRCCNHPVLPRVRAILSWEWAPPPGAGNANWKPVWGSVHECNVQIQPHPWNIFCLLELFSEGLGQKLKVPELFEQAQYQPIPLPDPPPFTLAQLAKMYGAGAPGAGASASAQALQVEAHRFGTPDLYAALDSPAAFDSDAVVAKTALWASLGLDLASAAAALGQTKADVAYEELECLGLDESFPERLVATFRIKRPLGYSGDLCHAGSQEYVAFWADWDDKCHWTYLGTVAVNVHDIKSIPKEGLCYSAILPVDLTYHRRSCEKPKIGRVRAVLSWAVPPSTTDPDKLDFWGNRLDAHVQINPGPVVDPGKPTANIRNLGGIPIEDIATGSTGTTLPGAVFAHYPGLSADGWGLGRACPFGGTVQVEGLYYLGYFYRVKVHKVGDPYTSYTVLADSFLVERWDSGFDPQISSGGFFKYLDPAFYFDRTLAVWPSSGDALWEVQLDIATAPTEASIFGSTPWYRIQLDNTAPAGPPAVPLTMDIHITSGGGDCKDIAQGDTVTGYFIADDPHFGGWGLSTEPNTLTTPSNPPSVLGLAATDPAPGPGGHAWTLDTNSPIAMKPCGYVVRLDVSDRTIVHSVPFAHNSNHIEVGFCLRAKK